MSIRDVWLDALSGLRNYLDRYFRLVATGISFVLILRPAVSIDPRLAWWKSGTNWRIGLGQSKMYGRELTPPGGSLYLDTPDHR